MKPRTKFQKMVVESAKRLPPLSEYQKRQAIKHVAPHMAKHNSKGEYVCLDCGHSWKGERATKIICPHCGAALEVDATRKWNYHIQDYFMIATRMNGLQVLRMFLVSTHLRRGEKAYCWIGEAFQRWIAPSGENAIISRSRCFMARYCDSWDWSSELSLKNEIYGHLVCPYKVIGRVYTIPMLERNGFDGDFRDCNPHLLLKALLKNNKIETLWKAGQFELASHFVKSDYFLERYWPSIKIVLRHHYKVQDASMWCDLLGFLQELGKDVRNPQLICPENLNQSHDHWHGLVEAKREKRRRLREQEFERLQEIRYFKDLKRLKKDEKRYKKEKSKFLDIAFSDEGLLIKPLLTVREFCEEGRLMHHCVFANKYFLKEKSLILHAISDGVPVATIELNLENLEVLQCRGPYNSVPPMKDKILKLIEANKGQIALRLSA